jgi:hypothetical protein
VEPKTYIYMSNMLEAWPFDRQEALLAPYLGTDAIYRDKISGVARKNHRVAALIERATMLRSPRPGRGDRLYVATVGVLWFHLPDLIAVLAEAEKHGLTIVDVSAEQAFVPTAVDAINRARLALEAARQGPSREKARLRAMEVREADTARRIELIRDDWLRQTPSTKELLERAGRDGRPMAYQTAALPKHLGPRPAAQIRYARLMSKEKSDAE